MANYIQDLHSICCDNNIGVRPKFIETSISTSDYLGQNKSFLIIALLGIINGNIQLERKILSNKVYGSSLLHNSAKCF